MIPRGPVAVTAEATSATERGVSTRAVVGAVRPHPCRLASVSLDIAAQATRPASGRTGRAMITRWVREDASTQNDNKPARCRS